MFRKGEAQLSQEQVELIAEVCANETAGWATERNKPLVALAAKTAAKAAIEYAFAIRELNMTRALDVARIRAQDSSLRDFTPEGGVQSLEAARQKLQELGAGVPQQQAHCPARGCDRRVACNGVPCALRRDDPLPG